VKTKPKMVSLGGVIWWCRTERNGEVIASGVGTSPHAAYRSWSLDNWRGLLQQKQKYTEGRRKETFK
jgi:hypothetical protein